MSANLLKNLKTLCQQFAFPISEEAIDKLLTYLALLQKWNRHYNLTAIDDAHEILTHHFMDSLAIAPWIEKQAFILDVGTGAGFPGIPLALLYPQKQFVLLDSRQKKTNFLQQVVFTLHLPHVKIVTDRVEHYSLTQDGNFSHTLLKNHGFDVIMCRALGAIDLVLTQTQHLIAPEGFWLLMKGRYPEQELNEIKHPYEIKALTVPGLSAERHVVVVKNQQE